MNKLKFESHTYIDSQNDSFSPCIQYEMLKAILKIFKKDEYPPEQIQLSNLQIFQIFNEALILKERKRTDDVTYIELLKFGINLIKSMDKYELVLYLTLYVDILKGKQLQLIRDIFDIFNLQKIIRPKNTNNLSIYLERIELLYNEQNQIFDKVKRIPMSNFTNYLIKFYTVYIYLYATMENYEDCERIMKDLRDNNPYDNLILAKLYLSEYSQFFRSIPISNELQNSLMGKFIHTSENYNNLLTSFSIISDYIKKDFINLILIITENYDKINDICFKSKSTVKINDYITQKETDDLTKVQTYLDFINQKKLEKKYKCIDFNLDIWNYYLKENKNPNFLEYLKSNLIKGSLDYNEIIESLKYIIKYTNKDFVEMLIIIVKNYEKLKNVCISEKKKINISDFIQQKENDDQEKIKENLSYILSEKIKDKYETIDFNINIWKYYITHKYQNEFLSFLENKIYESIISSTNIFDCLDFSSTFKNKALQPMLEIILKYLENIQNIFKSENKCIIIENYINQNKEKDDLGQIYELIKEIIKKEKEISYCSIKFNAIIWLPYSQNCDNLDILKYIRKIILECKELEPELNEDVIDLGQKIHDVGFKEIQKGILKGEKLLLFLGEDETFYVNKKINELIQTNINLQNQIDSQASEIETLKNQNEGLTQRIVTLEGRANNLTEENKRIAYSLCGLETEKIRIDNNIIAMKNEFGKFEKKMDDIKKSLKAINKKTD